MTKNDVGRCETCGRSFNYQLIHNGFNDTAYAYCDRCGMTCFVGGWDDDHIPEEAHLKIHQVIAESVEPFLKPCVCGGQFKKGAWPRCPHCRSALSAVNAASYIEQNAPGTKAGWRWQQNWEGLYCIIIENRVVKNIWQEREER